MPRPGGNLLRIVTAAWPDARATGRTTRCYAVNLDGWNRAAPDCVQDASGLCAPHVQAESKVAVTLRGGNQLRTCGDMAD